MTAKGHLLLASASALSVHAFSDIPSFYTLYPVLLLGSILPDIDEERSFIGRKTGAISVILHAIFGHRTVTHYLILPLGMSILGWIYHLPSLLALAAGILLHDIGDMLTKGGIVGFFFPFLPHTRIGLLPKRYRFYTGSIQESILILSLIGLHLFLLFNLFKERL